MVSEDERITCLRVFRHHQQRRRDGLPTVSLCLMADVLQLNWLQTTLGSEGLRLLLSAASDADSMACDWLRGIADQLDLLDEAFAFVAHETGTPESELRAACASRTERERARWLEHAAAEAATPLRAALESMAIALDPNQDVPPCAQRLRSLLDWLPEAQHLVFALQAAGPNALRALLAMADARPSWPLLAIATQSTWPSIREQLSSRDRFLLESTQLPAFSTPGAARRQLENADAATARDLRRLTAEAVREARAARDSRAPEADALTQRARSLAEQQLFELLERDATTRGLFQLNERLPFSFGTGRAEVDLVCAELRVAVEVDGYYHFQELDAYRRDRRKDVLLQQQGYLVSRHLASDVVDRPGEVLHAIRQLVLRRRRTFRRENTR